jgi:hypothetical protein
MWIGLVVLTVAVAGADLATTIKQKLGEIGNSIGKIDTPTP